MPKEKPMKCWLNILSLTTMLVLNSSANAFWGDTIEDGVNAKKNKEYCKAYEIFMKHAKKDDPFAQRHVGVMNARGECDSEDNEEAAKWYRKSADQGDVFSQNNLGLFYRDGIGVNVDKKEAEKLFRLAANQGLQQAQYNLGRMLFDGDGIEKNKNEAIKWLIKSAEQENAGAQNYLGWAYMDGDGVKMDTTEGVKWLRKAAGQGVDGAQYKLGLAYSFGKGVDKNYEKAFEWINKAAEQGHRGAQFRLGLAWDAGRGVKEDKKEAMRWYRKAADEGHPRAQYYLGHNLMKEGPQNNSKEGIKWLTQSAEQGDSDAQFQLGEAYYFGYGVTQDYDKALSWMRKSAEQDNVDALENIGIYHLEGYPVEQNFDEAAKYFKLAITKLDMTEEDDQATARELNSYLLLAATRGILNTSLSIRSKGSTIILDPGTYVIYLEADKRLLHPREGTFNVLPSISEGESLEIAIDKSADGKKEGEISKKQSSAILQLSITSDFLIREILLDGAGLPLSWVKPGSEPNLVNTIIDVSLSGERLKKGFLLKIHSREGKEHLRQVELQDGKLIVNSPKDTML
jgi:TPR repeat protein